MFWDRDNLLILMNAAMNFGFRKMWGITGQPAGVVAFKLLCCMWLGNQVYDYVHCHFESQAFASSQSCLT